MGYGRSHAWEDIRRLAGVWPLRFPSYTEDLQHGATIEGVRVVNPFV